MTQNAEREERIFLRMDPVIIAELRGIKRKKGTPLRFQVEEALKAKGYGKSPSKREVGA